MIGIVAALLIQTTTCNSFGTTTTCNTTPPPASPWETFNRAREASTPTFAAPSPTPETVNPRCASGSWTILCTPTERRMAQQQQAKEALSKQVTALLAANDCPGAIRTALEGGDMDLAREARDFCRP